MSEIKVDTVVPRTNPSTLTIGAAGDTVNIVGTAGTGFPSTTINNNADNKVITGSGSANTLEAEANLTFDGNEMTVQGTPVVVGTNSSSVLDLKNTNSSADGRAVGIAFSTNTGGSANAHITAVQDASAKGTLNFGGYDGTSTRNIVMSVDAGTGTVIKPLQPTFLVNVSSDSVHPNLPTGVTIIDFGSEAYDVGNNVSSVGVFTAPVTGKYQFNTSMAFAQITSSTTLLEVFIKASNREMRGCLQNVANLQAGDYQSFGFSTMVDMDASDTCFVQVAVTGGGGTIDVISGSTPAPLSFFSGTLIC